MKRQVVTLAIAVAVLAILAVMLTVFLLTEPPQQEPLADSKVPLFNLGEVWTSITVENAQGGYVMEHQGEAVAIQGLEELSLNEDLISRTVDIAVAPSAEREIRDVSNLENFGLEPARAVVTIEAEQGQQTFSIGSATPVDQGYYLLFENRVYLAAQEMVEPFLQGSLSFLSLGITQPLEDGEVAQTAELALSGFAPVALEYQPSEGGEDSGTYRMIAPVEAELDYYTVNSWLGQAFGLAAVRAEAIFPTQEQLEHYGLDEPAAALEVSTSSNRRLKLVSSSIDEEGTAWLMLEGVPVIYQVSEVDLGWMRVTAETLTQQFFPALSPQQLDQFTAILEGESYIFQQEEGIYSCNGQLITEEQFNAAAQAALQLRPKLLDAPVEPSLEPVASLTFTSAAGDTKSVQMVPSGKGTLYLKGEGSCLFQTDEGRLEELQGICTSISEPPEEVLNEESIRGDIGQIFTEQ